MKNKIADHFSVNEIVSEYRLNSNFRMRKWASVELMKEIPIKQYLMLPSGRGVVCYVDTENERRLRAYLDAQIKLPVKEVSAVNPDMPKSHGMREHLQEIMSLIVLMDVRLKNQSNDIKRLLKSLGEAEA